MIVIEPIPIRLTITIVSGDLAAIDTDGTRWTPIACGDHSPSMSDSVPDPIVLGFQKGCAACEATLAATLEHTHAARQNTTITVVRP